jgi:predicted alpha/beta superfamily hydrolase
MKKLLFLALLVLLPGTGLNADSPDFSKLQGLGDTRYQLFESEALGHPLYLYVRVPEQLPENPNRTFPTVYLLDGGINFPLLSAYYHYLRLGEELPEMILVGISYGSDTFEEGNFRSSDFTAAAPDREWWGKAPLFQSVLKTELIPLIESFYPADPAQRILFGQSLGGQFVLYSALTDPALFQGRIASNPALHRNLDFFLAWQGAQPMPDPTSRLFVSVAEFDDMRFREPANEWLDFWISAETRPWLLETRILEDQTHLSAAPEAFRQGLKWIVGSRQTSE